VNKQLIVILTAALGALLWHLPSAYGADARDAINPTVDAEKTFATIWESPTRISPNAGNADWNSLLVNKIVDQPTHALGAYSASPNQVGRILGYEGVTTKADGCNSLMNCENSSSRRLSVVALIAIAVSIALLCLSRTILYRARR
jgi:hypothetical protein